MATDPTNPAGEGDTDFPTADADEGVDSQPETNEDQPLDDDGNPIEEPPEDEEVELDEDLKIKVPKDQAQRVKEALLRQADYTRKTQALSDERKAFEAERTVLQQASQEELGAYAQATSFANQIGQLDRTAAQLGGWAAWAREDPFAANEAHMARAEYERAQQFALAQLNQYRGQRLSTAQQESAKRLEEARAALEKDKEIGGWDANKAAEVLTGGVREYGFDRSEIEELSDARMVKVLHDGLKWRAHLKTQQAANKNLQAQQAQPAAKVGAAAPPPGKLDDRLSIEEWNRRRNAQVRKRA